MKTPRTAPPVIESFGLADPVRAQVEAWFRGALQPVSLDGNRSVHVDHPEDPGRTLKIKGAGYRGAAVRFGTLHKSGPAAPVFDFEGRMMEDVAAGHDNAQSGGASFQQAATEWRVSGMLAERGYDVVPCLGYGRIRHDGRTSWFSVFDCDRAWIPDLRFPAIPMERWRDLNRQCGALILELAERHDLIGYPWYSGRPDGGVLLKDLHPFRQADPVNMSQLSWVMQVFFALHIRCNVTAFMARRMIGRTFPEDTQVWPVQAVCPSATPADHEALRTTLVAPYMLKPPTDFSPEALAAVLDGNPITRALMARAPARFSRF